jgi:serine/threonine protein kinase/Flp pilus assembly protein TadD
VKLDAAILDPEEELDRFIARFEAAHSRGACPDIIEFLPTAHHALYRDVLRELVRIDLEYAFEAGEPKRLQDYASRFPDFFADQENIEAVAYEEYRLRMQHGEDVSPADYEQQFAVDSRNWPSSRRGNVSSAVGSEMPEVGDRFLGFRLTGELGRGAFSTVFLAEQDDLAKRPVALKISREFFGESQTLAQLQHTNIVPVYSVHRTGRLQAICMPYFGSTTLADVLGQWKRRGSLPQSGKAITDTIKTRQRATIRSDAEERDEETTLSVRRTSASATAGTAAFDAIGKLSYVEAALWIAARLADGLAHAHQRGILHRDLKPANVLLAADGQPMLLDFNLSEDTKQCRAGAQVGGTLPYMSPEQLAALCDGGGAVDPRSDIYSLGMILYEMLAGRLPFSVDQGVFDKVIHSMLDERRVAPPAIRPLNSAVSPAAEAIVLRCLHPNPDKRYQSAAELREDLDRQQASLPLKHTREPSLRERARKWLRRNPSVASVTSVAALSMLLILGLAATLAFRSERLAGLQAQEVYRQFQDDLRAAQMLALDAAAGGKENSAAIVAECREALNRFQIEAGTDWQKGDLIRRLPRPLQETIVRDVEELLQLIAAMKGESTSLRSIASHPQSARDECSRACLLSIERRFRQALAHWQQAARLEPQNLWAWYGLGCCYEQLNEPAHAAACYTACIALAPEHGDWYFHRGVAYLKQHDYRLAINDLDRAIELQPRQKELFINRALAGMGEGRFGEAISDLEKAIILDGRDSRVYLMLAQARQKAGSADGAARARQRALEVEPANDLAWVAQGVAQLATSPDEAIRCFDAALVCNSHCLPALESKAHVLAEKLGQTRLSIAALDRAVVLYPEQASLRAARGVLLARSRNRDAAEADAKEALRLDDSDSNRYQVAGIYANLAPDASENRSQALALLGSALRHGYGADLIADDPDLDSLRDDVEFQKLLAAAQTLQNGSAAPAE